MVIAPDATLADVAAQVSEALQASGITATLSGGAAVSLYTQNEYQSKDLDFVTAAMLDDLKPVMTELGFAHTGNRRLSVFEHTGIEWYVEFVAAPVTFGDTTVRHEDCGRLNLPLGQLRVVTPTQCVMDRMAAVIAWGDEQSRDQAILVARNNPIDWAALNQWFLNEGQTEDEYRQFRVRVDAE